MALTYDPSARRWLDDDRPLTPRQVVVLRNAFADRYADLFAELSDDLSAGRIGLQAWADDFAELLGRYLSSQFIFGRGGIDAMDDRDWLRVAKIIDDQQGYFSGFVEDVLDGTVTEAQLRARAASYANAGVLAHSQALEASFGIMLPVYPADGGTACGGGCRCAWIITETDLSYEASWETMGDQDVCPGCQSRAGLYNPLVLAKPLPGLDDDML